MDVFHHEVVAAALGLTRDAEAVLPLTTGVGWAVASGKRRRSARGALLITCQ